MGRQWDAMARWERVEMVNRGVHVAVFWRFFGVGFLDIFWTFFETG
jgi:hypothetical protein